MWAELSEEHLQQREQQDRAWTAGRSLQKLELRKQGGRWYVGGQKVGREGGRGQATEDCEAAKEGIRRHQVLAEGQ